MSKNFEILPTNKYIPKCSEVANLSKELLKEYLLKKNININIYIDFNEYDKKKNQFFKNDYIITNDLNYLSFEINNLSEAFVSYHEVYEINRLAWEDEFLTNKRAKNLQNKICKNMQIGYFWNVRRTAGQTVLLNLYYIALAISIGLLTDGIIYSDDGAWEYNKLPIEANRLKTEYLNS